jgi:hypothetical protein
MDDVEDDLKGCAFAAALAAASPSVALASAYVATWLFRINAPNADRAVAAGWGFNLYVSLVAGAVAGPVVLAGFLTRSRRYCILASTAATLLLLISMVRFSHSDLWEGLDLLALPFLLVLVLGIRGVRLGDETSQAEA